MRVARRTIPIPTETNHQLVYGYGPGWEWEYRGPSLKAALWDRQRSMREQREARIGAPTRLDILASIGDRDDRGGGDEPTRGE